MLNTKDLTALAVALGTGAITQDHIRRTYGDGVLGTVLGLAGGSVVGSVAAGLSGDILDVIEDNTGLVSVADDIIESLNPFDW